MKEIDVSSLQSQFPDSWLIVWVRQWDENDNNIPVSGSLIAKSTSRDRAEAALKTAKELAPDLTFTLIFTGNKDDVDTTDFIRADRLLHLLELDAEKNRAVSEATNAISNFNLSQSLSNNTNYPNDLGNAYSSGKK